MYDGTRSGANLLERTIAPSNASRLGLIWSKGTGGAVQDTAVVHDGVVFVSSWDGYEYAFNASNGSLKWKTSVGSTTFSGCGYAGARGTTSTATVWNGTVYVGGGDARFYALNESNGSVNWSVSEKVNNPSAGDYNWGSPLIAGTEGYIGLSTACGNPSSQGELLSINLNGTTHRVTHAFAIVPTGQAGGSVWSTPAYDPSTNLVWVTTGDEISASSGYFRAILALNASSLALVGYWKEGHTGVDYDFGAGPTFFHDVVGHLYVGATNKNGIFYALNRTNVSTNGTWGPIWRDNVSWYANFSTGEQACGCALAPGAFNGSTLFLGGGYARLPNGTKVAGTVRAVDPSNGSYRWTHPSPGIVRAGISYADGLVVDAADANDNRTATLEVLSAATGQTLYQYRVNGTINAGPSVADGRIYFGTANWSGKGGGRLYALGLPLNLSVSPPSVAAPAAGAPVNFTATVGGGMPPYQLRWDWGDGSAITSGAAATHRYLRSGMFHPVLTVTDNGSEIGTRLLSVYVPSSPIHVTAFFSSPSSVVQDSNTTLIVDTSGGDGPLSYSYTGLPPGCTTANASVLLCVPRSVGSFLVGVGVSDGFGDVASANLTLPVSTDVSPLALLVFEIAPNQTQVGQPVTIWTVATGGVGPYQFAFSGLPTGCVGPNASEFNCTPAAPGNWSISVRVTDSAGAAVGSTARLVVHPATLPAFTLVGLWVTPSSVPVGSSVRVLAIVSGEVPPVSYAYSGLPAGCSSSNVSQLNCTPTELGTFLLGVRADDAAGRTVSGSVQLNITPLRPVSPPIPPTGLPNALYPELGLVAVGGLAVGAIAGILLSRRTPPPARPPGRT
ncbi:MAG: PQQ-binding-like beta-propeller repeat protein [Thermoplasmata archaeon]|nr:PQQ-binding-like beta-propeller repeat protein [Thermoplasmata archaeon]